MQKEVIDRLEKDVPGKNLRRTENERECRRISIPKSKTKVGNAGS